MAILVTGACGWIGRTVCSILQKKGLIVVGSDRIQCEGPWSRFQCLDITQPLDFSLSDIDTVIHCAGYAHHPRETQEEQELFYAVNREGTRRMLDWCRLKGIDRFLYVSTIAFYDWSSATDRPVDEDHPVRLETHYARSKYEGEQLVIESSLDWRVVRLATVFGNGDRANFYRMVHAIRRRLFFMPGDGATQKSVIPIDVAAELISRFALSDQVPHRLVNLALPEVPSLAEICAAYHEVCGLPPVLKMPILLACVFGHFGDLATKVFESFPFSSQILGKLVSSTVVSTRRMEECFPNYHFNSFPACLEDCKEYYKSL